MSDWQSLREIVRIHSDWVSLIAERWLCDKGKELEYWRVEKVDSVIVLPIHRQQLLCVSPTFRPGIQRATLDFPGGRLPAGKRPTSWCPCCWSANWACPRRPSSAPGPLTQPPG